MNKAEIKDFKQFLKERNVFLMFSQNYRQNHFICCLPVIAEQPTWC